jgi:hypothetical protein
MSQRGVEIVLGRLATDVALRRRFCRAPSFTLKTLTALGIDLSAIERGALARLRPAALERFARTLDLRLQKATLKGDPL